MITKLKKNNNNHYHQLIIMPLPLGATPTGAGRINIRGQSTLLPLRFLAPSEFESYMRDIDYQPTQLTPLSVSCPVARRLANGTVVRLQRTFGPGMLQFDLAVPYQFPFALRNFLPRLPLFTCERDFYFFYYFIFISIAVCRRYCWRECVLTCLGAQHLCHG